MCIATIGAFCIQEFPEAVGVMLFYRIGEYFEEKATEQSRTQIMEAVDLRPEVVNLVIGNDVRIIDAEEANVGDILLVRPGDRIPLDGVIIDGESRIDTSPVTGEPVPVMAKAGDNIVSFSEMPDEKTQLLMDSLVLGIGNIEAEYGNEYITLLLEEV